MNEVLARLERVYRQQLEIYNQVLELADEALRAARSQRPLQELDSLVARKHRLLSEIDRLDALAAADREWWKREERSASEASHLRQPLAEAARCIAKILDREREMERWILLRREATGQLCERTEASD